MKLTVLLHYNICEPQLRAAWQVQPKVQEWFFYLEGNQLLSNWISSLLNLEIHGRYYKPSQLPVSGEVGETKENLLLSLFLFLKPVQLLTSF